MAVRLEFINLLIPIEKIDAHYPGGFAQFCADNRNLIAGRLWHDDHLLRDGAMSPQAMEETVRQWSQLGLVPMEQRNGKPAWRDMCVVEELAGGPTLPCEWIAIDLGEHCAYLKDHPKGQVIGREEMRRSGA